MFDYFLIIYNLNQYLASGNSKEERKMLKFTNEYRIQNSLPPFKSNDKLINAAKIQSDYCAKNDTLSHSNVGKNLTIRNRVENSNYSIKICAENAAYEYNNNAKGAVEQWKNSPGHDKNLKGDYEECGYYSTKGNGKKVYWIGVYATSDDKEKKNKNIDSENKHKSEFDKNENSMNNMEENADEKEYVDENYDDEEEDVDENYDDENYDDDYDDDGNRSIDTQPNQFSKTEPRRQLRSSAQSMPLEGPTSSQTGSRHIPNSSSSSRNMPNPSKSESRLIPNSSSQPRNIPNSFSSSIPRQVPNQLSSSRNIPRSSSRQKQAFLSDRNTGIPPNTPNLMNSRSKSIPSQAKRSIRPHLVGRKPGMSSSQRCKYCGKPIR